MTKGGKNATQGASMRPQLLLSSTVCLVALASASAACGSLDGNTGTPTTLATVTGELSNPKSIQFDSKVRIAVVWLNTVSGGKPNYSVAEDLPVQPVFPSEFTIQLDEPPPSAALSPQTLGSDSIDVAAGFVVAYEDLNGNGKLDLVANDAGAFIDKIVGANESLALIYLQGDVASLGKLADSSGTLPKAGYNLFALSDCEDTDAGARSPDGGACIPSEWFDMSTLYNLQVSTDPEVNQLMCLQSGQGAGSGGGGTDWIVGQEGTPVGGYPEAGSTGLVCNSASEYTYNDCKVTQDGLCETYTSCTQTVVELGDASTPSGWPCP
jgi:hypothetical protein